MASFHHYYHSLPRTATVLGASGAGRLLGAETQGVSIDFTDNSIVVRDTGTPANVFSGNPNNKLTYNGPPKYILGSNGFYSSGTTLRTSYDASGNALGVLIEEERTNLRIDSQTPSLAFTNTVNVTVTDNTTDLISPTGSYDATKCVVTTSAATVMSGLTLSAGSGSGNTYSIFVHKGSGATQSNKFALYNNTTTTTLLAVTVNYDTGAITYTTGSSGASMTALPNGWWRLALTATTGVSAGNNLSIYNGFLGGAETAGVYHYIWQPQLEAGAFATSPIVTAGTTVTRAADNASLATTLFPSLSNGFSAYIRTMFPNGPGVNFPSPFNVRNGGTTERAALFCNSSNEVKLYAFAASVAQADLLSGVTQTTGTFFKAAGAWDTNDFRISANGAAAATDSSGTRPGPFTILEIAGVVGAPFYMAQLLLLPRVLTSPELVGASA